MATTKQRDPGPAKLLDTNDSEAEFSLSDLVTTAPLADTLVRFHWLLLGSATANLEAQWLRLTEAELDFQAFSAPPADWYDGQSLVVRLATPFGICQRQGRLLDLQVTESGCTGQVELLDSYCAAPLDMDQVSVDPTWALRIPPLLALRRRVLPFGQWQQNVFVACLDPNDGQTLRAVARHLQTAITPALAEPESLQRALRRLYGDGTNTATPRTSSVDVRSLGELDADDAVSLCGELLHAAIVRRASDIHIDPQADGVRIRLRVDGVLEEYRRFPKSAQAGVVSRFKVLSGLDIAEKRAPQDGGFRHTHGMPEQVLDIRTATLPTKHGERMTLRLLAMQTQELTLSRLGMDAADLEQFAQAIQRPHGMILLTGPTGSGKSTTLYAALRHLLGVRSCNIITVEDPIEYDMTGVAQVEIDAADKVNFSKALRSVLRHDPDVIMVGEIRDGETASIAVKASLTGHLVFSTLHTNSALSSVTRLCDMGVANYLVAATLRLAVAQRLVRRLCTACRRPRVVTQRQSAALAGALAEGETIYDVGGCLYCAGRGYSGRVGLFEILTVNETMARAITDRVDETALRTLAAESGARRLIDDASEKIRSGITTVAEVVQAVTDW